MRVLCCSKKAEQSESARYALSRLRQLTSARDTFVRAQTAAEHAKVLLACRRAMPQGWWERKWGWERPLLGVCSYMAGELADRVGRVTGATRLPGTASHAGIVAH